MEAIDLLLQPVMLCSAAWLINHEDHFSQWEEQTILIAPEQRMTLHITAAS